MAAAAVDAVAVVVAVAMVDPMAAAAADQIIPVDQTGGLITKVLTSRLKRLYNNSFIELLKQNPMLSKSRQLLLKTQTKA